MVAAGLRLELAFKFDFFLSVLGWLWLVVVFISGLLSVCFAEFSKIEIISLTFGLFIFGFVGFFELGVDFVTVKIG